MSLLDRLSAVKKFKDKLLLQSIEDTVSYIIREVKQGKEYIVFAYLDGDIYKHLESEGLKLEILTDGKIKVSGW